MSSAAVAPASPDFDVVCRQFETWRAMRRRGARIPEPLWQAAVELARGHGITRTLQALRLDYYALKERLDAATGGERSRGGADGAMIEVALPAAERVAECAFELDGGDGGRVRITFRGGVGEVECLAAHFWRTAR